MKAIISSLDIGLQPIKTFSILNLPDINEIINTFNIYDDILLIGTVDLIKLIKDIPQFFGKVNTLPKENLTTIISLFLKKDFMELGLNEHIGIFSDKFKLFLSKDEIIDIINLFFDDIQIEDYSIYEESIMEKINNNFVNIKIIPEKITVQNFPSMVKEYISNYSFIKIIK